MPDAQQTDPGTGGHGVAQTSDQTHTKPVLVPLPENNNNLTSPVRTALSSIFQQALEKNTHTLALMGFRLPTSNNTSKTLFSNGSNQTMSTEGTTQTTATPTTSANMTSGGATTPSSLTSLSPTIHSTTISPTAAERELSQSRSDSENLPLNQSPSTNPTTPSAANVSSIETSFSSTTTGTAAAGAGTGATAAIAASASTGATIVGGEPSEKPLRKAGRPVGTGTKRAKPSDDSDGKPPKRSYVRRKNLETISVLPHESLASRAGSHNPTLTPIAKAANHTYAGANSSFRVTPLRPLRILPAGTLATTITTGLQVSSTTAAGSASAAEGSLIRKMTYPPFSTPNADVSSLGIFAELMDFLDHFSQEWLDHRQDMISQTLSGEELALLLTEVSIMPSGHTNTIRDFVQSRCEPRVANIGEALQPTIQNALDHLSAAQRSRTDNAIRILTITTEFLTRNATLLVDQLPTAGLYMMNDFYLRPGEDSAIVGDHVHPSIISLNYIAGLWDEVIRRTEASRAESLTMEEYQLISDGLTGLRNAWELDGRIDIEQDETAETRLERLLRYVDRKIRAMRISHHRLLIETSSAILPVQTATVSATLPASPIPSQSVTELASASTQVLTTTPAMASKIATGSVEVERVVSTPGQSASSGAVTTVIIQPTQQQQALQQLQTMPPAGLDQVTVSAPSSAMEGVKATLVKVSDLQVPAAAAQAAAQTLSAMHSQTKSVSGRLTELHSQTINLPTNPSTTPSTPAALLSYLAKHTGTFSQRKAAPTLSALIPLAPKPSSAPTTGSSTLSSATAGVPAQAPVRVASGTAGTTEASGSTLVPFSMFPPYQPMDIQRVATVRPAAPALATISQPVTRPVTPAPTTISQPVTRPTTPTPATISQPVARPVTPASTIVSHPVTRTPTSATAANSRPITQPAIAAVTTTSSKLVVTTTIAAGPTLARTSEPTAISILTAPTVSPPSTGLSDSKRTAFAGLPSMLASCPISAAASTESSPPQARATSLPVRTPDAIVEPPELTATTPTTATAPPSSATTPKVMRESVTLPETVSADKRKLHAHITAEMDSNEHPKAGSSPDEYMPEEVSSTAVAINHPFTIADSTATSSSAATRDNTPDLVSGEDEVFESAGFPVERDDVSEYQGKDEEEEDNVYQLDDTESEHDDDNVTGVKTSYSNVKSTQEAPSLPSVPQTASQRQDIKAQMISQSETHVHSLVSGPATDRIFDRPIHEAVAAATAAVESGSVSGPSKTVRTVAMTNRDGSLTPTRKPPKMTARVQRKIDAAEPTDEESSTKWQLIDQIFSESWVLKPSATVVTADQGTSTIQSIPAATTARNLAVGAPSYSAVKSASLALAQAVKSSSSSTNSSIAGESVTSTAATSTAVEEVEAEAPTRPAKRKERSLTPAINLAELPIVTMSPEEEAAAIAEANAHKTGKIYKPDVKRKGAVIIPAHLYKAPKSILTREYKPEELEAMAAKAAAASSRGGHNTRRSSRRNADEIDDGEMLLDLETMKQIKRLKLQKEEEVRKEKEGTAGSSSSDRPKK